MQQSRFSINAKNRMVHSRSIVGGTQSYLNLVQQKRGLVEVSHRKYDLFHSSDPQMKRLQEKIFTLSSRTSPILISGEQGTGRSMIAKTLTQYFAQDEQLPCVEFFSAQHENATHDKIIFGKDGEEGCWQAAAGGFLIIDNLADLSLNLQNKLYKTLADKENKKPSSLSKHPLRVIFIASHRISELAEKNKIKSDLYHLLSTTHLRIPPLRHRTQDIPYLSEIFLAKLSKNQNRVSISGEAMAMLSNYGWPGNVTELHKVLNEAFEKCTGDRLNKEHLPLKEETRTVTIGDDWIKNLPVGQALRTVETHFILETIKAHQGNRTYAARTLGISLRTLRNKINEFTVEGYEVMSPQSGRRSASAS
ncbi:MAG: sigma 54-interacting transcriptional regulator [Proteobacteria bacterium]|nr:sigma 54-interacting transcriptional regulator [Pseudomonadota bacterium]